MSHSKDLEPAVAGAPVKGRRRGRMLALYVAGLLAVVLALLGAWLWTAWDNWQFGPGEARGRQLEAARELELPVELAVELPVGSSPGGASKRGTAAGAGSGAVTMEFVLIPAGMYDRGSPDTEANRGDDEGPLHRVRISRPFYMGRYEVTQEQWERVMGVNPSGFKGEGRLPVDMVSWNECQVFLKKLNALVPDPTGAGGGRVRAGPGGSCGFRLPTEAEWEWACRAGAKTRFSFGGGDEARLGEYAWYRANSGGKTHPVGTKEPNAWGLYDCHGNVREWCADWYGPYEATLWPGKFRWIGDPRGAASGSFRVLRGGSWRYTPGGCRSACCGSTTPTHRGDYYGLRVLVVVPSRGPR